jgi:MFS family permease
MNGVRQVAAPAGEIAPSGEDLALQSRRGRLALTATVAASGMASLDATVVNVALPHIGTDLDTRVSALQWVLTGYLLALASLILLGGALGDRYGRRKIFLIGTVWFAVASVLCGAAPSIEVLVGAVCFRESVLRCSRPAAWRSCKRASVRATAPRQLARGRAWAAPSGRSVRSSAVGWSTARGGGGRSWSTYRSLRSSSGAHCSLFRRRVISTR